MSAPVTVLNPEVESFPDRAARAKSNLINPGKLEFSPKAARPILSSDLGAWRGQAVMHNSGYELADPVSCKLNLWRMAVR